MLKELKHRTYLDYISLTLFHGSMEPTLQINDVIIVQKIPIWELQKGDIISFAQDEKIISHRIQSVIGEGRNSVFITKGDNNKIPDKDFVHGEQVYGKVVACFPKIGKFIQYIKNKAGFIRVAIIIIITFIVISLKEDKKNKRKLIRKKYELKRKREKYK